jgi:F-type H+-transporting ATPase subunit b
MSRQTNGGTTVLRAGLVAVGALALPTTLRAAQEAGGGGGSPIFSVDIGLTVWTWILFLLTLGILAWKVFPWIAGTLEERQRKIQDTIDQAAEDREEARRLLERHRREMAEARREAQAIVAESRETADKLREQILEEARQEREQVLERARREMERDRERLVTEVRREAVDVAIAAAERLIKERLDRDQDRRLVEDYLERLG